MRVFEAMLATHDALGRLGFKSGVITAAWTEECPKLILQDQGSTFVVDFREFADKPPLEEFVSGWAKAVEEWNEWPPKKQHELFSSYYDIRQFTLLGLSVEAAGLVFPRELH